MANNGKGSLGDRGPMWQITAAAAALDAAKRLHVHATVWGAEEDLKDAVHSACGLSLRVKASTWLSENRFQRSGWRRRGLHALPGRRR
ncbi:hypothetical protein JCM12141A_36700 [Mycolicibacterium hodleri]